MFYIWEELFVYTLRRYCVPLIFGFDNPIPDTVFIELPVNFDEFCPTGLFPKFLVLTLLTDWFCVKDWLFGFQDEPVPVETSLVLYFELPWNILSIC